VCQSHIHFAPIRSATSPLRSSLLHTAADLSYVALTFRFNVRSVFSTLQPRAPSFPLLQPENTERRLLRKHDRVVPSKIALAMSKPPRASALRLNHRLQHLRRYDSLPMSLHLLIIIFEQSVLFGMSFIARSHAPHHCVGQLQNLIKIGNGLSVSILAIILACIRARSNFAKLVMSDACAQTKAPQNHVIFYTNSDRHNLFVMKKWTNQSVAIDASLLSFATSNHLQITSLL